MFLSRARKEEKTQQQMTVCRVDLILAGRVEAGGQRTKVCSEPPADPQGERVNSEPEEREAG